MLTNDSEVFVQPVSYEDAAQVDQHSQLLVSNFEWNESVPRVNSIQVTGCRQESGLEFARRRRRIMLHLPLMPENSVK